MELLWIIVFIVLVYLIWGAISGVNRAAENKVKTGALNRAIDNAREKLLTGSSTASLPTLDADRFGYRLVGKEKLLSIQDDARRMELKTSGRYRHSGTSVSIPIVKGVRYRVGGGTIKSEKTWQSTDQGRLVLTDKAVSFEGGAKNERITWTQIANAEILTDGYVFHKRSGPPRTYAVQKPDPEFAAILELLLDRIE